MVKMYDFKFLNVINISEILKIGLRTAYHLLGEINAPLIKSGNKLQIREDYFYEWLFKKMNARDIEGGQNQMMFIPESYPRILTVEEVSKLLNLTPKAVYLMVKLREISAVKIGNSIRIPAKFIDYMIQSELGANTAI